MERSNHEYAANSASLVAIDPAIMERHALKVGDLVRVETFKRELWARVGTFDEADRDTALIRLDRFQRQTIKAHLHEKVEINFEEEHPVTQVRLQSAADLSMASSHHIEEHLKEEMVQNRTPVAPGAILYIHFHHSVAGTLYKVLDVAGAPGIVTEDTDVILDAVPEGFGNNLSLDVTFEDLGGLGSEIRLVQELIQLPLQYPGIYRQVGIQAPRGIIFYGPPGTGKTRLAQAIANEVNAEFYYINGPEVIGTTYGESEGNLRKIFGEASHHAPSVIFIDEIDALAPKRGETGSHSDTRIVAQILSLMDGLTQVDGIIVIATTNRIDALDVALRRPGRFDREIFIVPPNEVGRLQILQIHTREMPLSKGASDYLPDLAANTHGFVGADLMELCREAGLNALRRHAIDLTSGRVLAQIAPEKIRVERADFVAAFTHSRPSASREALVTVPKDGFEAVGGLHEVKQQLTDLVIKPLISSSTLSTQARGSSVLGDGIVLSGSPGTGKTLIAQAVAKEAGANLISVSGPELFSKWLGESEEAVRHVFKLARQLSPCIVLFDQLDALAPVRGQDLRSQTTERVVNQLLTELDALESTGRVVAIAATNRIDLIDPALLRSGRFGTRIELPSPSQDDRSEIVDIHLRGVDLDESIKTKVHQTLVERTQGLTGAQIRGLVNTLRLHVCESDDRQGLSLGDLEKFLDRWLSTKSKLIA